MAGYADTRQLIIDTLMGRPAGTEIQPEDHQAFALALNDYIRSVELVAGSGVPVDFAEPDTVPVQPNNGQAVYLSYVPRSETKNFVNFINQSGNSISVTSSSGEVKLVTLLWNGSYWSSQIVTINVLSDDSSVNASNIGASDYVLFSTSSNYSTGDIVRYDGKLYKFTADHAAGDWLGTDVELASINSILTSKLTELKQIKGGVYDVSANNDGATFESLQSLLSSSNLSTLIPESVRHGGMSIRFVQSSDNKYVQYILTSQNFSTVESDWQEIINNLEVCSSGSEFFIGDKLGYVILAVLNGYIKTKNFDSESVSLAISKIQEKIDNLSNDIKLVPGIMGDLSFIDINNFIIAAFKDGHIKTKNFDSSSVEYSNLSDDLKIQINPLEKEKQDIIKIPLRKSIKVLFIGNSISQDHVTYIPWLLSTLYNGNTEDLIDYTIGIFYIGSHRIDQYAVEDWDSLKAQIWSIADNTPVWTNTQNVTTLNEALSAADWDIISIQGYFGSGITDDVTKAVEFVSKLRQQVQNNFNLAYLIHQTYMGNAMFKTILEAAATVIQQNEVKVLFAPGLANEYAKQYFTNSQLTPDYTHNAEGLPCMIGSYECLSTILQYIKTQNVILGDTNILTLSIWETLNIPGTNGTMDESLNTEDNYKHIQECAISAFNKANMLLENLKTSNIYNYVKVNFN